jgi:hypothetical protein
MACEGCDVAHQPDGTDDVEWELADDLRREDIMSTGFIPANYTYPLLLTVTAVQGNDYNQSKICPPPRPLSSWKPPQGQDLLFTVTPMEDLADDDTASTFLAFAVVVIVCLVLGIPLVSFIAAKAKERRDKKEKDSKDSELPQKRSGKRYEPVPIAFGGQQYID